ncbi:GAF domain-containing protein [Pseudenhygromyxa sp. WMMC2535]|uniref:ATP-binding protein n=1 Tax=Pseudenhygromyxa sp. WMMC2535 TaxID=2712867 RepID=UPI00155437A4|nr:ATP-binding protein [Pseudenhygromyxa sp. WMMC2535]NVB43027.1 GAF domain-containing protein [Pseudenhygromyxa sp. WMMC2535]
MQQEVDLTNCDREPIHIPGGIQPFAALLVFDESGRSLLQASANLEALMGLRVRAGASAEEVLPGPLLVAMRGALAHAEVLEETPQLIYSGVISEGVEADCVAHIHLGRLLVELQPLSSDAPETNWLAVLSQGTRALGEAEGLRGLADRLAKEIRARIGYDRVMVYRFAGDDSGWVYAEARREDLEPFLDLHYPASDIPKQARRLFLTNRVRVLQDRAALPSPMVPAAPGGVPTDMTHTFCRAVSPIHLEYLSNMGVRATLSLALAVPGEDRLWGLVACHHYAGPKGVSYSQRVACDVLTTSASFLIEALEQRERLAVYEQISAHLSEVGRSLASHADMLEGIRGCVSRLRALFDNCGMCAVTRDGMFCSGETQPDEGWVRALLSQLPEEEGEVVAVTNLRAGFPALTPQDEVAGFIAVPFSYPLGAWLLWFRSEQSREVRWAGNPTKPTEIGPLGDRLTPRKSFDLWVESVEGECAPWTSADLATAERLRVVLSDVVYREREKLVEIQQELVARTRDLEAFSTMASHDLRQPLRAIGNYAAFLSEDNAELLDRESVANLEHIQRLVRRMYGLIEGMLVLSRLGRVKISEAEVDSLELVREIIDDLREPIATSGATIEVAEDLPCIRCWSAGLRTALTNLITNALKYSEAPPQIWVGSIAASDAPARPAHLDGDFTVLFVRDRGIGIDPAHKRSIFRMFHRLHPDDSYGKGTGVGLPIVRRAAERMGGDVWVDSTPGEGSCFYLALPGKGV